MYNLKDSNVKWLGNIPNSWRVLRLKNVLKERKENNNPIKTDNILSLTNDKGVIPYSERGNSGNKAKDDLSSYKLAYPNDIVMNSMNVIIGSVGLSKYFGCVSPVYYMLCCNNENCIRYYNYIFQSNVFQNDLKGLGNGILEIRMRIPMDKLNNVLLPVPPLVEQIKIADFLDDKIMEIDNAINKTKETIEDYKKYKQSLIIKVVTKGIEKKDGYVDSQINWIGKYPRNWIKTKLKNFCDLNNGKEIYQEINSNNENVVDVFGSGGVFKYTNEYLYDGESVLFGRKGTLGKPLYINQKFWTVDTMYYLTFDNYKIIPKFCYYQLCSFDWQPYITQTALPSIVGSIIMNCDFVFPSLKEQKEIVEYLDSKCNEIDQLIKNKEKIVEELENYKKSVIYEYVTGKKEVK